MPIRQSKHKENSTKVRKKKNETRHTHRDAIYETLSDVNGFEVGGEKARGMGLVGDGG